MMSKRLLLTTMGSKGDLYPVLAIAQEARALGAEVRLALSPEDTKIARGLGLNATAIGLSEAEICDELGVDKDGIAASFFRNPGWFINKVIYPHTAEAVEEIAPLIDECELVAGTSLALAGNWAAERARRA